MQRGEEDDSGEDTARGERREGRRGKEWGRKSRKEERKTKKAEVYRSRRWRLNHTKPEQQKRWRTF